MARPRKEDSIKDLRERIVKFLGHADRMIQESLKALDEDHPRIVQNTIVGLNLYAKYLAKISRRYARLMGEPYV